MATGTKQNMNQLHWDDVDDQYSQFSDADVKYLDPEVLHQGAINRSNSVGESTNNYNTGSHSYMEDQRIAKGYYGGVNGDEYIPIDGSTMDISDADAHFLTPEQQTALKKDKAKIAAGEMSASDGNAIWEAERAKYGYSGGTDGSGYTVLKNSDGTDKFTYSSAPEYVSKYNDTIQDLANQIANREKFSYNAAEDPLYQSYAEQYTRNGSNAMQNTLAQIASRTGGLASSYAGTAAQQTYSNYMQQLNDKIPELYQLAYNMYQDEGTQQRNNLEMYRNLDSDDYTKYQTDLNQYNNDLAFDYQNYRDNQSYESNLKSQALEEANQELNRQQAISNQALSVADLYSSLLSAGISPSTITSYLSNLPSFSSGSGGGNLQNYSSDGTYTPTAVTPTAATASNYGETGNSNVDLSASTPVSNVNTETVPTAVSAGASSYSTAGSGASASTSASTSGTSASASAGYSNLKNVAELMAELDASFKASGYSGYSSSGGYSSGTTRSSSRSYSRSSGSSRSYSSGSYSSGTSYSSSGSSSSKSGSSSSSASSSSGTSSSLPSNVTLPSGTHIQWIDMLRAGTKYTWNYGDGGTTRTMHISSTVGYRNTGLSYASHNHAGTDITMPSGTPVQALASGTVIFAGLSGTSSNAGGGSGYGYMVKIQGDDGYIYTYAHNSQLIAKTGDRIEYGDTISLSGNTGASSGPHLHFEIRDAAGNVVDSLPWIENYDPDKADEEDEEKVEEKVTSKKSAMELPDKETIKKDIQTYAKRNSAKRIAEKALAKRLASGESSPFDYSSKKSTKKSTKKTKVKKQNVSTNTGKAATSKHKKTIKKSVSEITKKAKAAAKKKKQK